MFLQQARGPAGEKYLEQLEADCHKLWTNGRQLCEQVSLTGNHCINQVSVICAALSSTQYLNPLSAKYNYNLLKSVLLAG